MAKVNLTTENAIVNAVGEMAFTGNVIPESWYKSVVSPNGRVNLLAVNLLGEIVYWYKPTEVRDERSGDVTWVKKFADEEYLQPSSPSCACSDHEKLAVHSKPFSPGPSIPLPYTGPLIMTTFPRPTFPKKTGTVLRKARSPV